MTALSRSAVIFTCAVLGGLRSGHAQQWTAVWAGVGRPGPENLPFTNGWPADAAGFEQYDFGDCYSGNGPRYAEGANVDTGGYLTIRNIVDSTCMGIGPTGSAGAPCSFVDPNPCGMRYQAGPRTQRVFAPNEIDGFVELLHYQTQFGFGTNEPNGMTFEITFNIQQLPTTGPVKLMETQAYMGKAAVGRGGAASFSVVLRKNLVGVLEGVTNNDHWYVVVEDGTPERTWNVGGAADMLGKWVTVRVIAGVWCGKLSKFVWRDGSLLGRTPSGTDMPQTGVGAGVDAYARFGPNIGDGDVRIATMAFSNQGMFAPNPLYWCHSHHCGFVYRLPYLAPVPKTRAHPEICNNQADDDGDGKQDCEDPDCWQAGACGNLLVNGSFENPTPNPSFCTDVPASGKPASQPMAWIEQGTIGELIVNSTTWVPLGDQWTHGFFRGSCSTGSATLSGAYQTVGNVPKGPVRLRGDILGAGVGTTLFIEMRDGNINGPVIGRFDFPGQPFDTSWRPIDLTATNATGFVTVRWGLDGGSGGRAVHVDNLYLAPGIPPVQCNLPFADADDDGDVDGDDFGALQRCFTGSGTFTIPDECFCFNRTGGDTDIDNADFLAFEACATGPNVAFNPGAPPPGCNP